MKIILRELGVKDTDSIDYNLSILSLLGPHRVICGWSYGIIAVPISDYFNIGHPC
jgi:hypothetical protein